MPSTTATVRPRLLIVEDDESMGTFVTTVLDRAGFDTTTVDSGEGALEALGVHHFDVLLVDFSLPGIDGLAVARAARSQQPSLGIALMTAFAGSIGHDDMARSGVDEFLPKPFTPDGLTARMRQLVRRAGDPG